MHWLYQRMLRCLRALRVLLFATQIRKIANTGDEAFKSICRVLGPLTKKPTLGVQHAVEAGYLFKEHASISAWLFTFLSYCEVTKPLSRIKTITRMRRIYKHRLLIPGFIISASSQSEKKVRKCVILTPTLSPRRTCSFTS